MLTVAIPKRNKLQNIIVLTPKDGTSEEERAVRIPVWLAGIIDSMELRRCMLTYEEGYNAGQVLYPVKDGVLEITLPPRGAAVLTAERKIQPDFRLK